MKRSPKPKRRRTRKILPSSANLPAADAFMAIFGMTRVEMNDLMVEADKKVKTTKTP